MNKGNSLTAQYRKEKGWTQDELAAEAGVSRTWINKIEKGFKPSVSVAQAIAKVLGFDWALFFEVNCDVSAQVCIAEQAAASA